MLTPVIGTAPLNQKPSGEIDITFFSQVRPTGVAGLPGVKVQTTLSRYEAHVTIGGGLDGRFRGSIYPDNMNVKGRLRDGTYDVYLGFHKPKTPTQHDLVVRTNGFRPVLVLNRGNTLPVISNVASKRVICAVYNDLPGTNVTGAMYV